MEYFKDKNTILYLGDCLEELKNLQDNSVDCIVTDPPYQLSSITKPRLDQNDNGESWNPFCRVQARKGFMGKEWDILPPIEVWKECLRVLKPGAFAFIMTTPRQDSLCQILMDITQAGFRMDFSSIYWTYASGFPKATNISKVIDKRLGCEREVIQEIKSGGYGHIMKTNVEQDFRPTDYYEEKGNQIKSNEPISNQVKEFDGSYAGFQPKPAVEIILVVMKPLSEKTFTEQALNNGHGITWLDDCRIPYINENDIIPQLRDDKREVNSRDMYGGNSYLESKTKAIIGGDKSGRFPANLLISDDILNDGKSRKGVSGGGPKEYGGGGGFEDNLNRQPVKNYYNDEGSFSRYFDLDFWFKNTLKNLPERIQKVFPFIIESKASTSEKNKGCENLEEREYRGSYNESTKLGILDLIQNSPRNSHKNNHPTVKPIKLMSYLVTLGSKKGNIILDPFMGSGSTGISTKLLERNFIGIEREEDYIKIAEQRIKAVTIQEKLI